MKHKHVGWVLPKQEHKFGDKLSCRCSLNQPDDIYIYTYPVFSGYVQPEYAKLIQATEATA